MWHWELSGRWLMWLGEQRGRVLSSGEWPHGSGKEVMKKVWHNRSHSEHPDLMSLHHQESHQNNNRPLAITSSVKVDTDCHTALLPLNYFPHWPSEHHPCRQTVCTSKPAFTFSLFCLPFICFILNPSEPPSSFASSWYHLFLVYFLNFLYYFLPQPHGHSSRFSSPLFLNVWSLKTFCHLFS
jgi:hypothetical protein